MKSQPIQLANTLTYLGALPFLAAVLGLLLGMDATHLHYWILTYAAVIIAFLSGMHWGFVITHPTPIRFHLLLSSNVFALLAWGSLWFLYPRWQYAWQLTCFVLLFFIDRKLAQQAVIPPWFYQLRQRITCVVILCLFALMVLL